MKSSHRFARVLPLRRDIFSEEQGHAEEEEEEEEEGDEGLDNRKKSTLPLKDAETLQAGVTVSTALCILYFLFHTLSTCSLENTSFRCKRFYL